jgi:hypothetical protein
VIVHAYEHGATSAAPLQWDVAFASGMTVANACSHDRMAKLFTGIIHCRGHMGLGGKALLPCLGGPAIELVAPIII